MVSFEFSPECVKRCPELQQCAAEFVTRKALGEDIEMQDVLQERYDNGTIPLRCYEGPVHSSAGPRSTHANYSEIAQATTVKIDAWGDLTSIRCRTQAVIGGGNINSVK